MELKSILTFIDKALIKIMKYYTYFVIMWLFVGSMIELYRTRPVLTVNNSQITNSQSIYFTFVNVFLVFRNLGYFVLIPLIIINFFVFLHQKHIKGDMGKIQKLLINSCSVLILLTFSYAIVGLMIDLINFAKLLNLNLKLFPTLYHSM